MTVSGSINNNQIYDNLNLENNGYTDGIFLNGNTSGNGNWNVYNNMIYIANPGGTNRLALTGINDQMNSSSVNQINYNSIWVAGSSVTTTTTVNNCFALWRYPGGTGTVTGDSCYVKNNILINTRSGGNTSTYFCAIGNQGNYTSKFVSNYNFLMNNASAASGRNDLGVWGGTVYPTFSSYQTASSQDANSFNATYNTTTTFSSGNLYPTNLFTNPAIGDLHIAYTNGTSAYQFIDARATPLAGITTDYDYQTRDPLTPDIGADEFNECSHIVITSQPIAQVSCVGSTTKFAVNNTGTTPYTYNWQFSTNNGSTWSPLIIAAPYATNISGDTLSIIGTPLTFNNYFYRVDVSNSCSDVVSTSALLTVMSGSSNVYLSTISDSMLVETCPDGSGWTYYSTYSDPTKWLFAINKNGNTFSATPILTMRFTGPTAYDSVSNPSNQTALYTMNRHWNVIMETGSIDSNLGKVSVRFFYNPADTIAMVNAAQAWVSGHPSTTSGYTTAAHSIEWFKTVHTSYVPSNNTSTYVPTAYTFDPSSYTYGVINGVNYVELDNIVSFSGGTAAVLIEPTAGSAISLPVTLLYLTATAENNQFIQLNWATASEINNAGFDIERSIDGVNFASIGWSAGHGNSSVQNEYMYQDMAVQPDIVYYYRLKQVNVDGQFVYTYIVSSSLVGHAGLVFQDMKPNPAINTIQLVILSSSAQQMSVNITDMLGRSVLNTPWQLSIGYNVNTFDISSVASGTYNVTILQGTVSITKRLTITK